MRDVNKVVHTVLEEDPETGEKRVQIVADDGDVALQLASQIEDLTIDRATDRKLLWKIDWYICPIMGVIYAVQFMDKLSNSYASIMGLIEDLDMTGNRYQWVGSAFYLGYLFFEFPASYCLQRLPIAKVTAAFVVLWGIILAVTGAAQSYAGFMALRTLLGCLESAVTPAFVLITAQWYKREEHFFRTSLWVMCNGAGSMVGSGIAYGLAKAQDEGTLPIAGWRLLFIIIGVITIVLGIVFGLHIPDIPSKAWFLNEEERLLVLVRIKENKQGFGNHHFKLDQLKEVFVDPRTYVYILYNLFANIPNGSITNMGSILLTTTMDFSVLEAYIMSLPQGAVELVGLFVFGFLAQLTKNRMNIAIIGNCINLLAGCLLAYGHNTHTKYAGMCLFGLSPIPWLCLLSLVASNTAGHTKKVVTSALSLIAYCVGNLIGPQTFLVSQAPTYQTAKTLIVVCYCITLALLSCLYVLNVWENKRRDRKDEKLPPEFHNSEFADLTDFQNPEFRYAL
jgi:ACS family allantoate permease-like MFS transporter